MPLSDHLLPLFISRSAGRARAFPKGHNNMQCACDVANKWMHCQVVNVMRCGHKKTKKRGTKPEKLSSSHWYDSSSWQQLQLFLLLLLLFFGREGGHKYKNTTLLSVKILMTNRFSIEYLHFRSADSAQASLQTCYNSSRASRQIIWFRIDHQLDCIGHIFKPNETCEVLSWLLKQEVRSEVQRQYNFFKITEVNSFWNSTLDSSHGYVIAKTLRFCPSVSFVTCLWHEGSLDFMMFKMFNAFSRRRLCL